MPHDPPAPDDRDYEAFRAALSEPEPGAESDVESGAEAAAVIAALCRIEALLHAQPPGLDHLRGELADVIGAIAAAAGSPATLLKLLPLLDLLERRITAVVSGEATPAPVANAEADAEAEADATPAAEAEMFPDEIFAAEPAAAPPVPSPDQAFAAVIADVMALSPQERIALFT